MHRVVDVRHDIHSVIDYILFHRILDDFEVIEQFYRYEWHLGLIKIEREIYIRMIIDNIYQKHWLVFVRVLLTNYDLELVHRVLLYRPILRE